jgi:hypothetical protein
MIQTVMNNIHQNRLFHWYKRWWITFIRTLRFPALFWMTVLCNIILVTWSYRSNRIQHLNTHEKWSLQWAIRWHIPYLGFWPITLFWQKHSQMCLLNHLLDLLSKNCSVYLYRSHEASCIIGNDQFQCKSINRTDQGLWLRQVGTSIYQNLSQETCGHGKHLL